MGVLTYRPEVDRPLRVPFFALHAVSLALLLLLWALIVLGGLRRHATIHSFFTALVFSGVVNLLLLHETINKPFAVFLAAGTLASTIAVSSTASMLILRTWSIVFFTHRSTAKLERAINWVCLLVPWVATVTVFVGIAVATSVKPNNVVVYYIAVTPFAPIDTLACGATALLFLIIGLALELWTIIFILLRPRLLTLAASHPNGEIDLSSRRSPFDKQFTLRVLVFGVWVVGGAGVLFSEFFVITYVPVLFQSTAGLAASLVFGSQRDVLTRLRLCSPLSHEHPSQQLTSVPKTPNTAGQGFSRSPTRPGPHRGETDETEDWEREGYEEGNGDGDGDGGETATATTPATTLDGEERKEMGEGEGEAMSMEDMLKFYSRPGDPFSSRP